MQYTDIFASDGFLHQICGDQSEANIRIPLYVVPTSRVRPGIREWFILLRFCIALSSAFPDLGTRYTTTMPRGFLCAFVEKIEEWYSRDSDVQRR